MDAFETPSDETPPWLEEFDLPYSSQDHFAFLEQLLNEDAAASYLSLAVQTLRNWRVAGGGPPFIRISPRAIRYRRRDLIAWINERKVHSTSEGGQ